MARRDADGYYTIVGRKKRFLKIFGNRVNLDETERLIRTNFATIDCACAGKDDTMHVFITDESLSSEIQRFLSKTTGLHHVAFRIVPLEVIPKNESGKTLYAALEKYYE